MMPYLQFFFGNRIRAISSVVVFGSLGLVAQFHPEMITRTIQNLLGAILAGIIMAIGPVMGPLMVLVIMGIGFRVMLRGLRGSGKK